MNRVSPEQLALWLNSHGAALVLYARQWCLCPEDVVQEAFVELLRQSPPPNEPIAWLFRVVRNRSLNASRANARRERHESSSGELRPAWFHDDMADKLDARDVTERLSLVPLEQREAIVARIWGGLSFEAIGELAGVSASTAFRRYESGLQTLRASLETPCPNTNQT